MLQRRRDRGGGHEMMWMLIDWGRRLIEGEHPEPIKTDASLSLRIQGRDRVTIQFCDHDFDGYEHQWHAISGREVYGCTYDVTSALYAGTARLCPVTLYVLGHFPRHIYIKQVA